MLPFGGGRPVKVKKLRTDRRIAAADAPPAVRDPESGAILWAPLIRHGARFPARPDHPALLLEIVRAEKKS